MDKATGYKITVDPQDINDNDFDDWMGSIGDGDDDKGDEDDEEMDEDEGWDDGDYDFLDPPK